MIYESLKYSLIIKSQGIQIDDNVDKVKQKIIINETFEKFE